MMRGLVLIAAMLAAPLQAQTFALRSGEHAGYTRLAFDLPADVGIAGRAEGDRVVLEAAVGRFDASRVFDRVPRTRLRDALAEGARLDLRLGCACAVDLVRLRPDLVVIDIRDPDTGPVLGADAPRLPPLAGLSVATPAAAIPEASPGPEDPTALGAAPAAAEEMRRAQEALLLQLSRAIDQGLLEVSPAGGATAPRSGEGEGGPAPGLSVRTAFDPADTPGASPAAPLVLPPVCEAATPPSFPETGPDAAARLITARAAILGEFDRPDPGALLDAVALHLALGLGVEAEALLGAHGSGTEGEALARDIARLVEGRPAAPDGPLAAAEGCEGLPLLLRLAAGLEANPPGAALHPGLEAALASLPPVLRERLGAMAARAILPSGRDLSAALLAVIRRDGREDSPLLRLTAGQIALLDGRGDEGRAALRGLLSDQGLVGAEAALLLARDRLAASEPIPGPLLRTLHDWSRTLRGTPLGSAIEAARIEAAALQEDLGLALEDASRLEAEDPADHLGFVSGLVARLPDLGDAARVTLLTDARRRLAALPAGTPGLDDARLRLAIAADRAGLPGLGLEILRPAAGAGTPPAMRVAAAGMAARSGSVAEALLLLEGLEDAEAERLRREMLSPDASTGAPQGESRTGVGPGAPPPPPFGPPPTRRSGQGESPPDGAVAGPGVAVSEDRTPMDRPDGGAGPAVGPSAAVVSTAAGEREMLDTARAGLDRAREAREAMLDLLAPPRPAGPGPDIR